MSSGRGGEVLHTMVAGRRTRPWQGRLREDVYVAFATRRAGREDQEELPEEADSLGKEQFVYVATL